MYYTPTSQEAFSSIENTMRYVNFGWLIRYMHSTGASAFFVVVYLHMYRCIIYGSYRMPRELLWLIGVTIYLLLMAEAYTGYLLPWGQMSFWASRVISSIVMAIPLIGEPLAIWFMAIIRYQVYPCIDFFLTMNSNSNVNCHHCHYSPHCFTNSRIK